MNKNISILSRVLLALAAALLVASTFVPIWQIELSAPQYPEGLGLKIFANKLGGNVDIINGLNHYIGMKTLHANDFIEFSVLVYIIGFYAAFSLAAAIIGKKKIVYTLFTMFVLFGVLAMADFWRWEYNYGHNLDPNAAIIVPGMAYQPPLIGFKQLLNFGAYSIPDWGGWFFMMSGLLMLLTVLIEANVFFKFMKSKNMGAASLVLFLLMMSSCMSSGPEPISYNKDACDDCKMTIADMHFACELVTSKGRAYKFDDVMCMMGFIKKNLDKTDRASLYVCDYLSPHALTSAEKLTFIRSKTIGGPMRGNTIAFLNADSAGVYKNSFVAEFAKLKDVNP